MALHRALRARFDQTVTGKSKTSRDQYGDPTFGSASTFKARVEATQHTVKAVDGREVLAKTRVFVGYTSTGGAPGFTVESLITLPDGSTPPILAVDTVRDRSAVNHQVVHCG